MNDLYWTFILCFLHGSEGSVLKTVIGALIIMCVSIGMTVLWIPPYRQSFAKCIVLIGTVAIYTLITKKVKEQEGIDPPFHIYRLVMFR